MKEVRIQHQKGQIFLFHPFSHTQMEKKNTDAQPLRWRISQEQLHSTQTSVLEINSFTTEPKEKKIRCMLVSFVCVTFSVFACVCLFAPAFWSVLLAQRSFLMRFDLASSRAYATEHILFWNGRHGVCTIKLSFNSRRRFISLSLPRSLTLGNERRTNRKGERRGGRRRSLFFKHERLLRGDIKRKTLFFLL